MVPSQLFTVDGFQAISVYRQVARRFPRLEYPSDHEYYDRLASLNSVFLQVPEALNVSTWAHLPLDHQVNWHLYHGTFFRSNSSPFHRSDGARPDRVCFTFNQEFADSYGGMAAAPYRTGIRWRTFVSAPQTYLQFRIIGTDLPERRHSSDIWCALPPEEHLARTSSMAYKDEELAAHAHALGFDAYLTWDTSVTKVGEHLTIHGFRDRIESKIRLLGSVDHETSILNEQEWTHPRWLEELWGKNPSYKNIQILQDMQWIQTIEAPILPKE